MSFVHSGEHWQIQRFVSGFSNNSFLLTCKKTGKGIVIDAPDEPLEMIAAAQKAVAIEAILITHRHHDHIEGIGKVTKSISAPVWAGEQDAADITRYSGVETQPLGENSSIRAGDITLSAIETPGHTKGSTCFILYGKTAHEVPFLFSGDTLFPGGPGRTATHSDFLQIVESIEKKLLILPDSTRVMPGHGEFTSIASVKGEFAEFKKHPLTGNECGNISWIA